MQFLNRTLLIDTNDFNINPIRIVPSIKKFVTLLKYCKLSDYEDSLTDLSENLSAAIDSLNSIREMEGTATEIEQLKKLCNSTYKDLFNLVTEAYINLGQGVIRDIHEQPFGEFHRLYYPDNSNKRKAVELIEQALNLITTDNLMPSKARNQIISQLNKVLRNLKSEKTNWSFHFGAIKEATILIAALVTIGGNKYNLEHLIGAKESLEEASHVIEITSINEKYIDYVNVDKQIFYIDTNLKELPNSDESKGVENGVRHNKTNSADAKNRAAD